MAAAKCQFAILLVALKAGDCVQSACLLVYLVQSQVML